MSKSGQKTEKTAKDLVREKYQMAFEENDGDRVYIRTYRLDTSPCSECGQPKNLMVTDYTIGDIGAGDTAERAWEDAAKNLGLLLPTT